MNTSLITHQRHLARVLSTRQALRITPPFERAYIPLRRDNLGRFTKVTL